MNKIGPIGLAAAVLVAMGLLTWKLANDRPASQPPVTADVTSAGSNQDPAPRQQLPPAPRPSVPSQSGPYRLDAASIQSDGIRQAEQATLKLEKLWRNDALDPAHAAKTEQAIRQAMGSGFVKQARYQPQQATADCRSSMCRIESSFAAGSSDGEWVSRTLLQMGGQFGASSTVVSPGENGTRRVVIYAFRPGRGPRR